MTRPSDAVRSTAREALLLIQALDTASEIQWEASPVPKPREDTSQRASGGHGDPTGDIVLDARRLALRDAVSDAEAVLLRYAAELMAARVNVDRAVARWNGE
ncbi:hypothetical protein SEA_CREWMATE_49 [Arthrobacter phage Crewmate]|uniref:Uncharacterized protein n=1 Tax=Arthrobacter phage Crewmate TaxID=2832317 RepID=A0AA48Y3L1_9CAUD|nr:hypothetical protein PQE17_gp49 [Arthrobacter phage Crewmate]UIW13301.1 hypothetical protein SEA_CREWMATE_49 [Arthrobacter phage Crewmate]WGH21225.1 hypothetical protein SEA_OBITOO_49 [Arthrobacter phage ObiToo]